MAKEIKADILVKKYGRPKSVPSFPHRNSEEIELFKSIHTAWVKAFNISGSLASHYIFGVANGHIRRPRGVKRKSKQLNEKTSEWISSRDITSIKKKCADGISSLYVFNEMLVSGLLRKEKDHSFISYEEYDDINLQLLKLSNLLSSTCRVDINFVDQNVSEIAKLANENNYDVKLLAYDISRLRNITEEAALNLIYKVGRNPPIYIKPV